VHYLVSGARRLNVVAVIEQDAWRRESWTEPGEVKDALAAFDGWHPQLRAILEAVEETYVWALFDHAPLARWSAGRVTLLGDAAHAMLPFMAQGAAQAIEDGATLAACLDPDIDGAYPLRRYEALRIPRTSRIQALSTSNKTLFHLADGPQQQQRDAQMAVGRTGLSFEAIAWIYGHDATRGYDTRGRAPLSYAGAWTTRTPANNPRRVYGSR
jgi:salicylate hydroxylase